MSLYRPRSAAGYRKRIDPMTVHVAFETPQDVHEIVYEMVKALGKDGRGSLKKGANEVTLSLIHI